MPHLLARQWPLLQCLLPLAGRTVPLHGHGLSYRLAHGILTRTRGCSRPRRRKHCAT